MADSQTTWPNDGDGLTEQERRVALAVGRGASNKATARDLGISIKTVEFHLSNIYRKLDVDGRTELAHFVGYRRLGRSADDRDAVVALAGALADGEVATPGPDALRNPYKGLSAFQETDALDFFGRERLVGRIIVALTATDAKNRFIMLVGPSGSGKSSVVLAGVVPALRAGAAPGSQRWRITVTVPGADALEELAAARGGVAAEGRQVLLVLDQFEELYTLCTDAVRVRFVEALVDAVVEPRSPLRVLATVRADFYDRPLSDPRLAPLLEAALIPVPPLTPEELERAIVEPARRCEARLEPGLAAVMAADVRDRPGALPLLQYALTEVFERSDNGLLTLGDYRSIGGVAGALSRRADELYTDGDEDQRASTRRVLTRLVSLGEDGEATRRRVRAAELGGMPGVRTVLARYGEARLLAFDRDPRTGQPTVELAHEAFLREWPRLRSWLVDEGQGLRLHRDLTARASAWEEGGEEAGELYRGGRLEGAEQWATDHDEDLNTTERGFLAASIAQREAEAEAERRNVRRIKRGFVLVAVVAVIALVAGAIAWRQQQRASSAARVADLERDAARTAEFASETGRLAALAPTLAETDPALAFLLAAEAERRQAGPDTWGALEQTLVAADTTLGFLPSDEPLRGAFFDGADRIVGVGDGAVTVWDARSRQRIATTPLPVRIRAQPNAEDTQQPLAFAAGTLVWVGEDLRAHLLDIASGDHGVAGLTGADNVALDATAGRLAVVSRAGDVEVSRVPGMEQLWTEEGSGPRSITSLANELGLGPFPPVLEAYPVVAEVLFSADSSALVVARGWSVTTRDAATGTELGTETFPLFVSELALETVAPHRLLALGYHAVVAAELPSLAAVVHAPLDSKLPFFEVTLVGLPDGRVAVLTTQGQLLIVAADSLTPPASPLAQPGTPASAVLETLDTHVGAARAGALSPDGSTFVAVGDADASLVAVDGGGLLRRAVPRQSDHLQFVGGRNASWVGSSAPISVFSPEEMRLTRSAPRLWSCAQPACTEVEQLALDPTTDLYAFAVHDLLAVFNNLSVDAGEWRFFDDVTLAPRSPAITPEVRVSRATIARDGAWVAIANVNSSVQFFELATGRLLSRVPVEPDWAIPGVTPLPDGEGALIYNKVTGESLRVDVRTGGRQPSPLAEGELAAAAFSGSGSVLVTAGSRGDLALRDGTTFEVLHRLNSADAISTFPALAFSDDERFLLTVHPAGGRLWDVATGQLIGRMVPTLPTTVASALPGEHPHLLTASEHWVQIWEFEVDRWGDLACVAAGRNLSRQEWEEVGPRDTEYHATCPQWPAG